MSQEELDKWEAINKISSASQSDWDRIELIDKILWYDELKWWQKLLVKVKIKKYEE